MLFQIQERRLMINDEQVGFKRNRSWPISSNYCAVCLVSRRKITTNQSRGGQ